MDCACLHVRTILELFGSRETGRDLILHACIRNIFELSESHECGMNGAWAQEILFEFPDH